MSDVSAGNGQGEIPYRSITIQGLSFDVPQPYRAGPRDLTEGEASTLNQTLAENLRNNFASSIKEAEDEYRKANNLADDAEVPRDQLDHDQLSELFATYATEYKFGVVRGGGQRAPTDPVLREAHRIALEKIKSALKAKNTAISSVSKEKLDEFIKGVLAKYPDIMEEARRRVQATAAGAEKVLEGLSL